METRKGRVQGKVAVITGSGGAIGRAIAIKFLKEGAKVSLVDLVLPPDVIKSIIDESGCSADSIFQEVMDVSKEENFKNHFERVVSKWGRVDIMVNNAAAFVFGTVEDATNEDWDRVLNVNVKGYAFGCKYAVHHMKKNQPKGGAIVNVASISSFVAQPQFVPYNTSKGAILQLTRCVACDSGPDNIRVNAVCPGTIDTPATSKHAEKLGITKAELTADAVKDHFLKRLGTTEDVANSVLFLASDESSFITGTTLMLDGGYTAH